MAEDDGLLLNLSSHSDGKEIYTGKIDRKSKWKERKLQKRQRYLKANVSRENKSNKSPLHPHLLHKDKASFHTSSIKPRKESEVQEGSASSSVTENGAHSDGKQSRKKIQVISRLFNYNPEIPKLPASSIELPRSNKEQREKVFSGDKFSDLDLSAFMVSNLENNLKLTTMTSVQKAAIPSLLEGTDVFVKSKTGTGKTLTYAVPVIQSLQKIKPKISRNDGPYAVILVPTRELAIQSFDVLQKLVKPFQWVVPGIVTGGEKRKSEKARIRKGINVLVATPGRLLDHIEKTKSLELRRLRWIVLDEADRLLDLGFEKDVSSILTAVKKALFAGVSCQAVLLSATLNEGVQRLAGVSLHKPLFIDVTAETRGDEPVQTQSESQSSNDVSYTTPEQLKQFFLVVPSKLRLVTLAAFLLWKNKSEESAAAKVIVFLSSRDSVDFHCSLFKECLRSQSKSQLMFFKLHGNMSQSERTDVFKKFSEAKSGILFCTDVAARGLDLPHVNWIIQYNTPGDPADYVHRVGRTARIGLKGNALLFLTPAEVAYLETLKQHRISPQELLVNDVLKTLASSPNHSTGKKLKNVLDQKAQESATNLQNSFENYVLSDQHNLKAAKKAYQSFVRAYATYPSDLKHIFHIRNLHLGHVAKSFALREAPKEMFQARTPHKTKKRKRVGEKKISVKRRVTEYSSDTDLQGPLPKKRKKNKPR